jgi:predicted RNA-binding protein with PUA-like domain
LKKPVPLTAIKADKRLADMALVRLGRLSVQPVTQHEWDLVMDMARRKSKMKSCISLMFRIKITIYFPT